LYKRGRPKNRLLLPSVSVVSLSQCWGTLDFFYKNNRPIFQTFQNRRNSGSLYFKPSRTGRFHRRTSGYLTFSNVFVDNGFCLVPTCRPEWTTTYLGTFIYLIFQWGLLVAISNVANVKFELPRPLNPGYSFQFCCVAKLVIVHARRFTQIWL
jgi:hypothetical protein